MIITRRRFFLGAGAVTAAAATGLVAKAALPRLLPAPTPTRGNPISMPQYSSWTLGLLGPDHKEIANALGYHRKPLLFREFEEGRTKGYELLTEHASETWLVEQHAWPLVECVAIWMPGVYPPIHRDRSEAFDPPKTFTLGNSLTVKFADRKALRAT